MSRFNTYMNSHFSGCRLLGEGEDLHRNRHVKLYVIPGHVDVVGVSDGVDSWLAPANNGIDYFTIPVTRLMREISDGLNPAPFRAAVRSSRVRIAVQEAPVARKRIQIDAEPAKAPGRIRLN